MPAYIDAHCHLDLFVDIRTNPKKEDDDDIKTITVTNAPYLFTPNQLLFANCSNIRVGLGFHPEALADSRLLAQKKQQLEVFDTLVGKSRYIGEVGLDGSTVWKSTWPAQLTVFQHVTASCEQVKGKIISAHSRGAVMEVLAHLASPKMIAQDNRLILHWFSGTPVELKAAITAGVYFSVNHKMLRSNKAKSLVALMPRDRVLTETDAPFTFDTYVNSRKQSLVDSINSLSMLWQTTHEQTKKLIWTNFQQILS